MMETMDLSIVLLEQQNPPPLLCHLKTEPPYLALLALHHHPPWPSRSAMNSCRFSFSIPLFLILCNGGCVLTLLTRDGEILLALNVQSIVFPLSFLCLHLYFYLLWSSFSDVAEESIAGMVYENTSTIAEVSVPFLMWLKRVLPWYFCLLKRVLSNMMLLLSTPLYTSAICLWITCAWKSEAGEMKRSRISGRFNSRGDSQRSTRRSGTRAND